MKTAQAVCASCLLSLTLVVTVGADVVVEPFSYPIQNDSTGFMFSGETIYRITDTGNYGGGGDLTILTYSEGFSSGAGIADEAGDMVAFFDTSSQTGFGIGEQLLVGVFDVPGFGDTPPGGPFGTFFSSPQDLRVAFGSVDIRRSAGSNATFFRYLAIDNSGNEFATNMQSLTGSFQSYGYTTGDFVVPVQGSTFDETQVVGVGIEFFADADGAGNLDGLQFRIDDFNLTQIPEPGTIPILLFAAIGMAAKRRRSNI